MKQFIQKLKSSLKNSKRVKNIEFNTIDIDEIWYAPELTRDEAEIYLLEKEVGVFIVRKSESKENCFVLSVKVAKYLNANEISHYLISHQKNIFELKGHNKHFHDLKSLVTHCSVIRDILPVLLNLKFFETDYQQQFYEDKSDNYMFYSSSTSSLMSFNSLNSSANISY